MVDIFGLKKESDTPAPISELPQKPPARGRRKLWAALLVLDAAFIIVFGGAVAAKLYQHLKVPAVVVPPGRRAPPVKAPAPKAPEAAPQPAKPQEPAPAAPPAAEPAKAGGPRPSLLAEPVKGRQAPQPQAAAKAPKAPEPAAPAAPASPSDKPKAVSVEFKLNNPHAKHVRLVGAFIVRGGRKDMVRHSDGLWTLNLHLLPSTDYRYWFVVDGKKTIDPENPKVERGASVLSLP